MENRFCVHCGKPLAEGENKCLNCGFEVQINREKNKHKKSGNSVLAKIATVFLCVLLAVTSILTVFLCAVGNVISEDTITEAINNIDIYDIVDGYFEEDSLESIVRAYLSSNDYKEMNISEKTLKKYINSSKIKSAVSEKIVDYIRDIKYETGEGSISEKEIIKILKSSEDKFESAFGVALSNRSYENIRNSLKDFDLDDYSLSKLRSGNEEMFVVAKIVLSEYLLYGILVVDILLIALILLANSKKITSGITSIGVLSVICGVLFLLVHFAVKLALSIILNEYVTTSIFDALSPLMDSFTNTILCSGAVMAGTGILAIIISAIINAVMSKKQNGQQQKVTQ